jgi:RimJ/RimL family protein N-acetyltransferase
MELVNCTSEYWEFIRIIRTHPDNQKYFLTQPQISQEQQIKYMGEYSSKYKICLSNNQPIGYIGLIKENEITYCVHPDHQGKGIGTFMISEFIKIYNSLTAFVLPENIGSNKVFEKLGFTKHIFYTYKKQ